MRRHAKKGFTLIETLIVSGLSVMVLGMILSLFSACQRLIRETLAESEMTLAAHGLREKLLYRLTEIDAEKSSGLLNATGVSVSDTTLKYSGDDGVCRLTALPDGFATDGLRLPTGWLGLKGLTFSGTTRAFERRGNEIIVRLGLASGETQRTYTITVPCYGETVK